MAYEIPRPYRPHDLHSPNSFESLQPPPSASYSHSGETSPLSSSDGIDGAFATLQGQGKRQQRLQKQRAVGEMRQTGSAPPAWRPPVHPRAREERVDLGGTGYVQTREDPKIKRKRVMQAGAKTAESPGSPWTL
ncbi:hypothetical protein JCM11251_001869 [Rhodosporidiobolus azoricus]